MSYSLIRDQAQIIRAMLVGGSIYSKPISLDNDDECIVAAYYMGLKEGEEQGKKNADDVINLINKE